MSTKKMKKINLNSATKHSFYVATNNAGLLRNGRPNRSSQNFKNRKDKLEKLEKIEWNCQRKFD